MKEFAGRTHQAARHELARDYAPPDIQAAAMPVRVEKRRTPAGLSYRIVGIVWGGDRPADRLAIRFGADDSWRPVAMCPARLHLRLDALGVSMEAAGRRRLQNRAARPRSSVPQRRLDGGYYVRQVRIEQL